jgi:hypothetical protein
MILKYDWFIFKTLSDLFFRTSDYQNIDIGPEN